jgi:hypothetical protein
MYFSRSSSSLRREQEGIQEAISLLESKHADLNTAGRGDYVHAMAMTKTTRDADLDIRQSSIVPPRKPKVDRIVK